MPGATRTDTLRGCEWARPPVRDLRRDGIRDRPPRSNGWTHGGRPARVSTPWKRWRAAGVPPEEEDRRMTAGVRWLVRAAVVAAVAASVTLGSAAAAPAASADRECAGRGVPDSKISIQLWTFAEYIGFGTDAATIARTEEVFGRLSEMGYRNVEPFTLSGLSAEEYRALLDKYDLKASARHVERRHAGEPGRLRPDPGREQGPGDQVLRLRLHPDIPADLHHRGRVGRLRRVSERARRARAQGGPDADGAQPRR